MTELMSFQAGHLLCGLNFQLLPQELVLGLLAGAIYALIALGYTMVYGILKLINFAHGEVFMLGAYGALFASWALGFKHPGPNQFGTVGTLLIMLLAATATSAIAGLIIERLAYRPLRNSPRIAALITAIGMSLLLQYGGQLFLPNSPPPNINAQVNPFASKNATIYLKKAGASDYANVQAKQNEADVAKKAFDDEMAAKHEDRYNLTPAGTALKEASQAADEAYGTARRDAEQKEVSITIPVGQIIMLVTTLIMMVGLTFLVMFTKVGRAMRAVSHDFESASLMGINVNRIITFTFFVGSALAGAAAMMSATFLSGVPISTFFGATFGVKAFVAAVLGGIGNVPGAVLGGILMGIAEYMVVWVGYPDWRDAVAFLILIVVLLFRPGGLLGSSKVEKV